jgi:phage terminase small subunit
MLQDANSLDDLTDLQRNFVIEYSFDRNKTAAYRRAKGKLPTEFGNGDASNAIGIISNPKVKKLIDQMDARAVAEMKTSREELLDILIGHARNNVDDFATINDEGIATLDLNRASRAQLRSITEITQRRTVRRVRGGDEDEEEEITDTRLKRVDPLKAIELLGKTAEYRMFSDQLDLNNAPPPQLQVVLVVPPGAPTLPGMRAPALPAAIDPPPLQEPEDKDKQHAESS